MAPPMAPHRTSAKGTLPLPATVRLCAQRQLGGCRTPMRKHANSLWAMAKTSTQMPVVFEALCKQRPRREGAGPQCTRARKHALGHGQDGHAGAWCLRDSVHGSRSRGAGVQRSGPWPRRARIEAAVGRLPPRRPLAGHSQRGTMHHQSSRAVQPGTQSQHRGRHRGRYQQGRYRGGRPDGRRQGGRRASPPCAGPCLRRARKCRLLSRLQALQLPTRHTLSQRTA